MACIMARFILATQSKAFVAAMLRQQGWHGRCAAGTAGTAGPFQDAGHGQQLIVASLGSGTVSGANERRSLCWNPSYMAAFLARCGE